jgi:diguanylate cyclase (GGDEF)-like protein/PAS domain S-box-containing protein
MDGYLSALSSLSAFAEVEGALTRENFEPFAAREIKVHPAILCLEWLPHVLHAGRPEYERTLSAWESRPVQITYGASANPKPSGEQPDYFPITLMYPRTAAANIIGFNGYSLKELRAVLDRSRDTGEPTAATKFHVIEPTADGFAVPVYLPVYKGLGVNPSLDDRRRAFVGYVLGIIDLSTILEKAIQEISPASVNIQFYDLSAAPGKQFLHFHRAAGEPESVHALSEKDALGYAPVKFIRKFTFASRQWAIVCTPTARYLNENKLGHSWGVLVAGLVCTLAIAAYLSLNVSYTAQAESLVAQLYQINSKLNREIEERRKAEEEISRLNASLEQRVNERTEALRESDERYALAARGSKDGLWDWNLLSGDIYFSPRWKNMLGYAENEISADPTEWFRRMHPDEAPQVRAQIEAHRARQTPQFQSEHRMLHKDGVYRWMLSRGVAVRDEHGRATRMAGSQTDITEGKVSDPLTGLHNRIFLADRIQQAIERARDSRSHLFAVLFLDLDRFKIVNDSLGHKTGDLLLRAIAARLRSCAEAAPLPPHRVTVARLGGDEFAVLLDGIASATDATDFAETIQSAMKPAYDLENRQIFATCSIGVALGGPDTDANDLLRDADTAMYHAKAHGTQRYEVFDCAMRQRAIERLQLETDLRAAVPRGELVIHYQPKVSLTTGDLVELEALVRWNHPVRGIVLPQTFVPLADETGLIVPIGEWVLNQSCRQMADWRKRFGCNAGISVNISARQFETSELVNQVRSTLTETGLPPSCLSLEITESLLLDNPESAIRQLGELRALGIGLKIDDFGTGFSSLSYLHRLPFNELKIDRSFVGDMGQKRETGHIVRTIILLARLLGMRVVAEGVETEAQLMHLSSLSCDYAQGNLFSEPIPAAQVERFLGPSNRPFFRPASSLKEEVAGTYT